MPETTDPILKTLEILAGEVREACREGRVVACAELWKRTEEEFLALSAERERAGIRDIALVNHGKRGYFYSERLMTRSYAEAAARACDKDTCLIIAETVREDSRTYPRPTPVEIFREAPYNISPDLLAGVLAEIPGDPQYSDIRLVRTSDGSDFLYSSIHLAAAQAESLAEWTAAGHLQNP